MKKFASLICLGLCIATSTTGHAGSYGSDMRAFSRDVNASNSGMEVIEPFASADATGQYVNVRFEIYPVNSTTKLYATQTATVAMPAAPDTCDVTPTVQIFFSGLFFADNNNIIQEYVDWTCSSSPSGGWTLEKAILFSANVSQANGAAWIKQFPSDYWAGIYPPYFDMVDANGDGSAEVMLSTDSANGDVATVTFLNAATGAVVIPAKARRLSWNINSVSW